MVATYLLFESSSGFSLFEVVKHEEIQVANAQKDILDLSRFSEMVKLKSFVPFPNAESALENINAISEAEVTPFLMNWLETSLPKTNKKDDKKSKIRLGVSDAKLGGAIKDAVGIECTCSEGVEELLRGVRLHFTHYIKGLRASDLHQAQVGLSHSYSRSKVKFNVHRVDNMIIQSSALLDQLDKDLNTFSMRVREWYSWHFPELVAIVSDNYQYAKCARLIKNKSTLTADSVEALAEITQDEAKAKAIVEAAKISMGTDISDIDMANVENFASRVVQLADYRKNLNDYLTQKMNLCAPNLTALIGEHVGARLISHAGSLTNLAKYPASTVQILGAEKALFRALKTKGNTPKYGLIFHSTFIGRAGPKNKGRISRYLANKCSIASRIDCFSDDAAASNVFGQKLREQVEERLEFYKTGVAPRKNIDVMHAAIESASSKSEEADGDVEMKEDGAKEKKKKDKKDKKDKKKDKEAETEGSKKDKKDKKRKAEEMSGDAESKPKKSKK